MAIPERSKFGFRKPEVNSTRLEEYEMNPPLLDGPVGVFPPVLFPLKAASYYYESEYETEYPDTSTDRYHYNGHDSELVSTVLFTLILINVLAIVVGISLNSVLLFKLFVKRKLPVTSNVFSACLSLANICFQITLFLYYNGLIGFGTEVIFGRPWGLVINLVFLVSIKATGFILMVMSYSRYRLVAYPLKSRTEWTPRKAWLCCFLCLLASVLLFIPTQVAFNAWLNAKTKDNGLSYLIAALQFGIQFCLPLLWVGICYVKIILIFRRGRFNQVTTGRAISNGNERKIAQNRRLLKITVAVVLVYAFTWGPFQVVNLLFIVDITFEPVDLVVYTSVALLAIIGGCSQTILYGWKTIRQGRNQVGSSS